MSDLDSHADCAVCGKPVTMAEARFVDRVGGYCHPACARLAYANGVAYGWGVQE